MTSTATTPPTTDAPEGGGKFLISVILDRTGSMAACRDATVTGFNEFLHQQQADPNGEAWLSLTLFDKPLDQNDIEQRFSAQPIAEIPDLGTSGNPYEPRGMTPLYDAIGATIRATEAIDGQYDRVLFVIQTDGEENASSEWSRQQIFDLITKKRADGWAFAFFGADQNAYTASAQIGVAAGSTMSYTSADSAPAFAAVSASTTSYRASMGATSDSFFGGSTPQDLRQPQPTGQTPSQTTGKTPDWRSKAKRPDKVGNWRK